MKYPLITTSPYDQLDESVKLTFCTIDKYDTSKTMIQNEAYIICQDIYLDRLIEFLSRAYGSMVVQYLRYIQNDSQVTKLIENY